MRTATMNAREAAQILFGWRLTEPDFDPAVDQFASGADVCEALAEHFGFTDEDYRALAAERYTWLGWEDGEDACDPPEPGKVWLTIADDGAELAVIVHRRYNDERDAPAMEKKEAAAQRIVDALNASERGAP